jgi:hypothetical protein
LLRHPSLVKNLSVSLAAPPEKREGRAVVRLNPVGFGPARGAAGTISALHIDRPAPPDTSQQERTR